MEYRQFDTLYVVRLNKGEEICETLLSLLKKERIPSAAVSGIGATDDVTVGVYDPEKKAYAEFHYTGPQEILSLTGNVSEMNGETYLHLHITCADATGRVTGGHLLRGRISLTAEITILPSSGIISRLRDEDLGINLWHF